MIKEVETNEVMINEVSLPIKEFEGKRVVTFKDIDKVHDRVDGTAKRNFIKNRNHFIEGVDYFILKKNDVGTNFVLTYEFNGKAPSGTVVTESGYLMIVKSFTDDKSWEVQRDLVNSYFKLKEVSHNMSEEIPVNVQTLNQFVVQVTEAFKIVIDNMNSMNNMYEARFKEFKNIIENVAQRSLPIIKDRTKKNVVVSKDPIRDTIRPLAELYNDKSVGYNNTYRKVYAAMEVDWRRRKTRYKNIKGNKNKPSKLKLMEQDKKLLSLFSNTVNQLIKDFTEEQ